MKPTRTSDRLLLDHMKTCVDRIAEYTQRDRARFFASTLIQDAVVPNLQTLAESSQRLGERSRKSEPGIPWRQIAGLRNVLVRDDLGVDLEAIWRIVEGDLPAVASAVDRMRGRLSGKPDP